MQCGRVGGRLLYRNKSPDHFIVTPGIVFFIEYSSFFSLLLRVICIILSMLYILDCYFWVFSGRSIWPAYRCSFV